ncbi:hypothetical protein [Streptomyces sp. NPDC101237]|uniref:hypothetical protein n=1 Tax=Streptomyces sp. NPDC101237 TaxID=3366139 RepID=UPI0037F3DFCB
MKRSHVLWLSLALVVLLAAGTVAWGAPRDQWDYRQVSRAGLPAVTFTGDKTAPDTLKLYMQLFIERVRDANTDGLEDLSWHDNWFARRTEAAGARWLIRRYGKGAAGPVSINMAEEDPYDVRGGTIYFRRTGQQQNFTVFKRNGLWLFAIYPDWNKPQNAPGMQPLKV